ncbi:MAG TPA: DedA family protein [Dokdonella sp.]|uniref:DedA family protein n=1 Tax=Dokdonella sp. TaxID=2291710 RepID=UPI002D80782D|nr:DedA family protein [Dokdonella sp.]HET9033371.1 DedA family protein [Dokdonella sp.]
MLDFLVNVFTQNGYAAVFIVLMICGFGLPIPEDITLVAGGVIAGLGYANVHVMCAVGILGILAGDVLMFVLGRIYGERALRLRWIAYLMTPRRYALVQAKFSRYGNRLMFIARFLPGLRSPIYLTAGMTRRISFVQFFLMDAFAALISAPIWVYLGYYGAQNHEWLLKWLDRGKFIVMALVAVILTGVVFYFWRRTARKRELMHLRQSRRKRRT